MRSGGRGETIDIIDIIDRIDIFEGWDYSAVANRGLRGMRAAGRMRGGKAGEK